MGLALQSLHPMVCWFVGLLFVLKRECCTKHTLTYSSNATSMRCSERQKEIKRLVVL